MYFAKPEIQPVVVIDKTEKTIFLEGGRKTAIENQYLRYFPTWDEAKIFLVARYSRKVANAKTTLKMEEENLKKAQELKP